MSVRVIAYAAAAAVTVGFSASAIAQSAQSPASDTIELPEVVVTVPSPVVKPSKNSSSGGAGAVQAAAQEPQPEPTLQPLPNAIVGGEGLFVPVTVTTDREFLSDGGATVTDTLQHKPGISGTNFAPGANRPIIRGLDSYRIRTQ